MKISQRVSELFSGYDMHNSVKTVSGVIILVLCTSS